MSTTDSHHKIKIFKSPFLLFFQIFFLMLFISIFDLISILSFDLMQITKPQNALFSYEEKHLLASLLIQLILVAYLFLQWGSDYYYFDKDKLLHKTGIIFKKIDTYDLSRIDNLSFHQKIVGRIFDYGDVTLFFGNQIFILKSISNPYEFTKTIERHNRAMKA